MLSFLPASGTVTKGFAQSFPVLDADQTIDVAGVPYTVPRAARSHRAACSGRLLARLARPGGLVAVDLPAEGWTRSRSATCSRRPIPFPSRLCRTPRCPAAAELLGGRVPVRRRRDARRRALRRPDGHRQLVLRRHAQLRVRRARARCNRRAHWGPATPSGCSASRHRVPATRQRGPFPRPTPASPWGSPPSRTASPKLGPFRRTQRPPVRSSAASFFAQYTNICLSFSGKAVLRENAAPQPAPEV